MLGEGTDGRHQRLREHHIPAQLDLWVLREASGKRIKIKGVKLKRHKWVSYTNSMFTFRSGSVLQWGLSFQKVPNLPWSLLGIKYFIMAAHGRCALVEKNWLPCGDFLRKKPTELKNEFMNLSEMRNDCSLLDTINPSHCKLGEKSPVFSLFFLEPCLIPHGFMLIFPNSNYRVVSWNSVVLFSRSINRQLFLVFVRLRWVFLHSRLIF